MTPEKESQLIAKYPKIFGGSLIDGGLACGDGWYDLLDVLCFQIQQSVDNAVSSQAWRLKNGKASQEEVVPEEELQVVAAQVKEKFGGLRFYVDNGNDRIYGLISMAESMSYRICEDCGNPGKSGGRGWIRTLCDPCRDAFSKRKFK
jgi:hypothetical protein